MIRLIVDKAATKDVSGTSKAGKPYAMSFQTAYAFCVDPETGEVSAFPDKFEMVLPKGQEKAYPKGEYTLSPASIYVDRDGKLALRPVLIPARPAAVKS